jgi:hypothetical protein
MTEQSYDDRVAEVFRAAVTYELVCTGAEAGVEFVCTEAHATHLHRMIQEHIYRAMVLELWAELFVSQNPELLAQLSTLGGVEQCLSQPLSEDALLTEDTRPPSKS